MEIQHFSHHHPLFLLDVEKREEEQREGEEGEWEEEKREGEEEVKQEEEKRKGEEDMACCRVCTRPVVGVAYRCRNRKCYFVIHKSCAELAREINHPFHPRHLLTLTKASYDNSGSFNCDACGWPSRSFTYHCSYCSFDLDLSCASLMPNNAAADDHQSSITHRHSMTHCDINPDFNHPCSGCLLRLNNSVYVCVPCKLILHKSCAELPQKIQQPFRHRHPLYLIARANWDLYGQVHECKACLRDCSGLYYSCSNCDYCLDVGCAIPQSPVPIINSQLHYHPLAFIDSTNPAFGSSPDPLPFIGSTHPPAAFGSSTDPLPFVGGKRFWCVRCRNYFNTPFFCCVDCKFNLHLHCIPTLPHTIKYDGHKHLLFLTHPRPIKSDNHPLLPTHTRPINSDEAQDDDEIHYCHACEKERRWFDPCYSCQTCTYFAHVDCVASEVMPILAKNESLPEEPKGPRVLGSAFVMVVLLLPFIHWVARAAKATMFSSPMFSSPLDKIVLLVFGISFWPSFS